MLIPCRCYRFLATVIFAISISYSATYAEEPPVRKGLLAINRDVLQAQLEFLASDWMEGRRTGEKGELIASDYIASMLRLYGVKPWGDPGSGGKTYFQNFILTSTVTGTNHTLNLVTGTGENRNSKEYTHNVDFLVRPSGSEEIEAPVVFAGYGFINKKLGINDLDGIDITGKFILKLSGYPDFAVDKLSTSELRASRSEFEELAKTKHAAGIIEVNVDAKSFGTVPPRPDLAPSEKMPRPARANFSLPSEEPGYEITRIYVSREVADEILSGIGNNITDYLQKADVNQRYALKPIPGKTVKLKTEVKKENVAVRNVLGIIEGNKNDEIIILGAHYDHMGINNGYIWNGADDNGSGTVGIMTLAKAIMETGIKPEKTIIIALWTAEEQGLLGSEFFVRNLPVPKENIGLYLNFDMISRYISEEEKNKVTMTYTSSQKNFRELTTSNLREHNIVLDVDFQPSDDPPGGSDHRSFVAAGIPIMRFKPGHREEYHTPADEVSTVDWDIMEKIVKISFANIWQLANSEY